MPGTVYRGRAAEPAGIWKDGKLLDKDGVGTLLSRRGSEWFAGKSASPTFRQQGAILYRGASSEPFCRVSNGQVLKGNSSEAMYRFKGDGLLRGGGHDVVVRGEGLTSDELLLAALALDPPR